MVDANIYIRVFFNAEKLSLKYIKKSPGNLDEI